MTSILSIYIFNFKRIFCMYMNFAEIFWKNKAESEQKR